MRAPTKRKTGPKTIRARIQRGKIVPVRALKMAEGTEVMVTINTVPSKADLERFKKAAGAWKGHMDAEKMIRDIYEARIAGTRPLTRP